MANFLVASKNSSVVDQEATRAYELLLNPLNEREFENVFGQMINFFECSTGSIEIVRDAKLHKVNFILLPYLERYDFALKQKFNNTVDRSSLNSKTTELLAFAPKFIANSKNNYNIEELADKIVVFGPVYQNT